MRYICRHWNSKRRQPVGACLVGLLVALALAGCPPGDPSDTQSPSTRISSSTPDTTNATTIPVTVTFSESVTGFAASDVGVTNAALQGFAGSEDSYTFNLVPAGDGEIQVTIQAGVAQDAAGNGNLAAATFSRTYDGTAPTLSLASGGQGPSGASPMVFALTFDEPVTGLETADLAILNGTPGELTGSGTLYSLHVTPSGEGPVTVTVAAGAVTDIAGNGNARSVSLSRDFDATAPRLDMTSDVEGLTNAAEILVNVKFSEPVTGLEAGEIEVTNAKVTSLSGAGDSYEFYLQPASDGYVTAVIPAYAVVDAAGNPNPDADYFGCFYDGTSPAVTLYATTDDFVNSAPIPIIIAFSEPVFGFEAGSVTVTNAVLRDFTGTEAQYQFQLEPLGEGEVGATVPTAAAHDNAGNSTEDMRSFACFYDGTPPEVTIQATSDDFVSTAPIPILVAFSEAVSGFEPADIILTNAELTDFTGSDGEYEFQLHPLAEGEVTALIPAGAAHDVAGNANPTADYFDCFYDETGPEVALYATTDPYLNTSPIPVSIAFSEAVSGFAAEDVSVTNAVVSNFTGSGAEYQFDLEPIAQGQVTATVPVEVAEDAAGNLSVNSEEFTCYYDGTAPVTTLIATTDPFIHTTPIPVQVAFSEAVSGFEAADVTATNATVNNFAGADADYSFDLKPTSEGEISAVVPAGAAQDIAGNPTANTETFASYYDATPPQAALYASGEFYTNSFPIVVAVAFSESVTGFSAEDVVVTNATLNAFTGSGASYQFELEPLADGPVTATVPAGVAEDAAGNTNIEAPGGLDCVYDGTPPTATIDSATGTTTNASPISVAVTFSETVTGFAETDLEVTNAAVSGFSGSDAAYAFSLEPAAEGELTVIVPGGAAHDRAGNGLVTPTPFVRYYDETAPTTALISETSEIVEEAPIPVTVVFSEPVTGLSEGDISVTNATVMDFGGSGAAYSFNLQPTALGVVTVDIAEGAAFDVAGNPAGAATQLARTYVDIPDPVAVIGLNEPDWNLGTTRFPAVSISSAYVPFPVFLEGWESTPRDDIVDYAWDFGDGSDVFHGFNAAHVYETPGIYTISLTVENSYGRQDTDTVVVEALARDGRTFYVDADLGNDANAGTGPGVEAWQTATRAFGGGAEGSPFQPGDQILFTRGQVFPMEANSFTTALWSNSYGYMFGAYGTGEKPVIELAGTTYGTMIPNPSYFGHVAFTDLAFYLTSPSATRTDFCQLTQKVQNILFYQCDFEAMQRAFALQNDVSGAFVVGCNLYQSEMTQVYTTCSRVALLDNIFDFSNNHIAYLEVINKGVIARNTFSRPAFGRTAMRLCGRESPTTNNVVIVYNHFEGWIDPIVGGSPHGDGTRYNWLLVHLAPNTTSMQNMTDVVFESNTIENAETLLNIGNYENLTVRYNWFSTPDTYQARRVIIGSIHGFDTKPVKNVRISQNAFVISPSDTGITSCFSILSYDKDPYEGRTRHEDVYIEKNMVSMAGGPSRVLWFEADDADQIAEVTTDNLVIYTPNVAQKLYQVGGAFVDPGTTYTLSEWRTATENGEGTQVYSSDLYPLPGWAWSPPHDYERPTLVTYMGASATGTADLLEVRLWVKKNDGSWLDTGLTSTGESGSFNYDDGSGDLTADYAFALQAEDTEGRESPIPHGYGHSQTAFGF